MPNQSEPELIVTVDTIVVWWLCPHICHVVDNVGEGLSVFYHTDLSGLKACVALLLSFNLLLQVFSLLIFEKVLFLLFALFLLEKVVRCPRFCLYFCLAVCRARVWTEFLCSCQFHYSWSDRCGGVDLRWSTIHLRWARVELRGFGTQGRNSTGERIHRICANEFLRIVILEHKLFLWGLFSNALIFVYHNGFSTRWGKETLFDTFYIQILDLIFQYIDFLF